MDNHTLKTLLELSQQAYNLYIQNGRKFFHALTLYEINCRTIETLFKKIDSGLLLSESENQWLIHLIQWKNSFDYFKKVWQPNPDDVFAFEKFQGSYSMPQNLHY